VALIISQKVERIEKFKISLSTSFSKIEQKNGISVPV
jgi:hypothetical protein